MNYKAMRDFAGLLADYNYEYPAEAIAQSPAEPRDSARLLVYNPNDDAVVYDTYANLVKYLPSGSCIVFNQTKVIPARIKVTKKTGGQARILYLRDSVENKFIALCDRKLNEGDVVKVAEIELRVEALHDGEYEFFLQNNNLKPLDLFYKYGYMPLPPYLKNTPLAESDISQRYQTVFAKNIGSVAAPTASLHFTPELLQALTDAGHQTVFVTLHVNIGTFLPLKPEQVERGELHEEFYEIDDQSAKIIETARNQKRPIIAVGTTVVRTLEAWATTGETNGATKLFIEPGYQFNFVDGLITNFHVPKSSLLMLVSALTGREKLLALYQQAIKDGFRLFSFGDGMFIKPKNK